MSEQLSLGREQDNDVVISHPYLSQHHAILTIVNREKMEFHIKDLGTTNGTYKNGKRVKEANFTLDDAIKLAGSTLESSMFLPLLYSEEPLKKGKAKQKKRKTGYSQEKSTGIITATIIIAAIAVSTGVGYAFNESFDVYVLLQILSLWMMLMLAMRITQNVIRNQNLVASEVQYRKFLFLQWKGRINLELKKQQRDMDHVTEGWNGYRKFEIAKRVAENNDRDIVSFYLVPHDKKKLPEFRPGQYLTFRLDIPGQKKAVIRCYSLSDRFHEKYYRVSIKKILPPPKQPDLPPGMSSNFFHNRLKIGAILDIKAPSGKFYLNDDSESGVVLIAGGVGITPMVSMLNTLTNQGSKRQIWFFYGVRNGSELAMAKHLKTINERFDNVHMHLCFSNPLDGEKQGEDFQHDERVSVDMFKRLLSSNNYEYYMCGPPPMMTSITEGLEAWGVPDKDVYFEAFGPASVKKRKKGVADTETPKAVATDIQVEFAKSGKKLLWAPNCESLLEFAENNGIELSFGCRAGNCGTCQVAMRSGSVTYNCDHDVDIENGSCLTCISKPGENLVLDA